MRKFFLATVLMAGSILLNSTHAYAAEDCDWNGDWTSNQGLMSLETSNKTIIGTVDKLGSITASSRKNNRNKCELTGTFSGTSTQPPGHFLIRQNNDSFAGKWGNTPDQLIRSFKGERKADETQPASAVQSNTMGFMKVQPSHNSMKVYEAAPAPKLNKIPSLGTNEQSSSAPSAQPREKFEKKWTLKLGKVCLESSDDEPSWKEELYGMAWAKFRIVNKFTGNQEVIVPMGGFANTSGDPERFWEVYPNSGKLDLREGFCNFSIFSLALISYEIDARAYGYEDIAELERDPRNRLEITVKLKEYDSLSRDDDLGTRTYTHRLINSDFDGLCYAKMGGYDNECMLRMRSQPGVITGFRDGGTVARVILKLESE